MFRGLVVLAGVMMCGRGVRAQIPEQYPKPLVHTAADHPAAHVLIVSVDGLHAFDLANYVAGHPASTLAALSARGVTYTNAHAPLGDPAVGLLALVTGGTPISTGVVTSDGLPADAHGLVRVNTIFEVVHQKIGPTAWVGESAGLTDLLRGPSGKGLDVDCGAGGDAARVDAVIQLIDGRGCGGSEVVPVLYGLSWTGVAAAQSNAGYADSVGAPSPGLTKSMDALDGALGAIVRELKAKQLFDSTWIVVTAAYGQARLDAGRRRVIATGELAAAIKPAPVRVSGGDVAMIWLKDHSSTAAAVKALEARESALGIEDIYSGERMALTFNRPKKDARMPDILVQVRRDVVYAEPGYASIAAHGGIGDWDTHVAMLISGAQLTDRNDPTWVPTTQLGPLLLRALGMEKFDLDALHHEHSPALPGIF
jgi:Type I phosphodiesterase / nucleotide pyrophosphatase